MPAEPGSGAGVADDGAPRPAPGPCSATDCCDFVAHNIRSRPTASAVIVVLMLSSVELGSLDHGSPRDHHRNDPRAEKDVLVNWPCLLSDVNVRPLKIRAGLYRRAYPIAL